MKISKQARRDAKSLFQACFSAGVLDEAKVRTAVQQVIAQQPRGYVGLLHHFQRLVKLDIERRSARVENAVATSPELMATINAQLAKKYGDGLNVTYWIKPELIGGIRIKVGSDVYDGSIQARLQALQDNL